MEVKLIFIMLILCSTMVSAFQIDNDDNFYLSKGETIASSFILYETNGDKFTIETDSPFISFDENKYVNKITLSYGIPISAQALMVKYYVQIPEETDIGVYRTTIAISNQDTTKYLNVKISVQNGLFKPIIKFLHSKNSWMFIIGIIMIILIVKLITIYKGGKN